MKRTCKYVTLADGQSRTIITIKTLIIMHMSALIIEFAVQMKIPWGPRLLIERQAKTY